MSEGLEHQVLSWFTRRCSRTFLS